MKQLLRLFAASALVVTTLSAATRRDLELRAYLHDPVRPSAELKFTDKAGVLKPLELMTEGLSASCIASLVDDELILQGADGSVAARAKVPGNCKRAAVIVVPAPEADAKPPYKLIVLDDAPAVFPWGASRVISTLGAEVAVQAGEHRLPLPSGKITPLPEVKKVDEFNMAQVNFYYREGTAWAPFTERRMQFTGELRRIFLVHVTPGSQRPFVTTLVDYQPPAGR